MRKYVWSAVVAFLACAVIGCSSETTSGDMQKEKDEIKKQTPANLEPVNPGNDMQNMGGGNTADQGGNIMPKGVRGKK